MPKTYSSAPGEREAGNHSLPVLRERPRAPLPRLRRVRLRPLPRLHDRVPEPASGFRRSAPAVRRGILRLRACERGQLLRPDAAGHAGRRLPGGGGPAGGTAQVPRHRLRDGHADRVNAEGRLGSPRGGCLPGVSRVREGAPRRRHLPGNARRGPFCGWHFRGRALFSPHRARSRILAASWGR